MQMGVYVKYSLGEYIIKWIQNFVLLKENAMAILIKAIDHSMPVSGYRRHYLCNPRSAFWVQIWPVVDSGLVLQM